MRSDVNNVHQTGYAGHLAGIEPQPIGRWRKKPQPGLSPPFEEDLDILGDVSNRFLPACVVSVMDQLLLQHAPEASHEGIVKAVRFVTHRRLQIEVPQYLPVFMGAMLYATITVMGQPSGGPFGNHGLKSGLAHQVSDQSQ